MEPQKPDKSRRATNQSDGLSAFDDDFDKLPASTPTPADNIANKDFANTPVPTSADVETQAKRKESDGLSAFGDGFDLLPVPAPAATPAATPAASTASGKQAVSRKESDGLSAFGDGFDKLPATAAAPTPKRGISFMKAAAPRKPSIGSLFARAKPDYARGSNAGSIRAPAARRRPQMKRAPMTYARYEDDYTPYGNVYDTYVNPAYEALNPEYNQPASAKPVWGFGRTMPRVVRAGMIPKRGQAEPTGRLGGDVTLADLEKGRVKVPTRRPAEISAQVGNSRRRRESKLLHELQRGSKSRSIGSLWSGGYKQRMPSASTHRRSRGSAAQMSPSWEDEEDEKQERGDYFGQLPLKSESLPRKSGSQASSIEVDVPSYHDMLDRGTPAQSSRVRATSRASRASRLSHDTRASYFGLAGRVPLGIQEEDEEPDLEDDYDDEYDDDELDELNAETLIANPPVIQEQFNNHTTWSVIRTRHRESLAEFLAVFVQLTIGLCANIQATVKYNQVSAITTAWAWGFSTIVAIHIAGGVSGAHLNPAFTILLWIFRGFPGRMVHRYIVAQFVAAFCAALLAYGLYYGPIHDYEMRGESEVDIIDVFITTPRYVYVTGFSAFLMEFVGTALIACTVLALGDDQNVPPGVGMNPLIIGLVGVGFAFSFTFQTGFAGNPARDFAPRLVILILGYGSELFTDPYWFYGPICGPIGGALFGALIYDVLIFTGGESPVNYPWGRTKRACAEKKEHIQERLQQLHWINKKNQEDDRDEKSDRTESFPDL